MKLWLCIVVASIPLVPLSLPLAQWGDEEDEEDPVARWIRAMIFYALLKFILYLLFPPELPEVPELPGVP